MGAGEVAGRFVAFGGPLHDIVQEPANGRSWTNSGTRAIADPIRDVEGWRSARHDASNARSVVSSVAVTALLLGARRRPGPIDPTRRSGGSGGAERHRRRSRLPRADRRRSLGSAQRPRPGRPPHPVRPAGPSLAQQGLTELFFESAEPRFDELSPEEFFERFAEGRYTITGRTIEGDTLEGSARFSHRMPAPVGNVAVSGVPLAEDCDDASRRWSASRW